MQPQDPQQRLAALRDIIAGIERKPVLMEPPRETSAGRYGHALPVPGAGAVQEVFTDAPHHCGASLAFAFGQGRDLLTPRRPAILYLQLTGDAQFFGLPYGPALPRSGLDPQALIIVRTAAMNDFLWATEEALASTAVAGVVADIGGMPAPLDFTASRRLSLRAAESGTSLFLLRYGRERQASAAHLRWRLSPTRSARKPYDDRAPGAPRWQLQLERGTREARRGEWLVEWTENGFATLPAPLRALGRHPAGATVPAAVPALLADRLSQTA